MTSQTGTRLRCERTLDAGVDKVYAALTSRTAIGTWFGPSDDFRIIVHEWNCTTGGRYKVEFNTPAGETHICIGEFKKIVPQEQVSYTWSWEGQPPIETLVTFEVEARGARTNLTLVHEGFPTADMCSHHEQGWRASLERLARTVA